MTFPTIFLTKFWGKSRFFHTKKRGDFAHFSQPSIDTKKVNDLLYLRPH